MDDFVEYVSLIIRAIVGIILIFVVALSPFLLIGYFSTKSACDAWDKNTDRQVKFVEGFLYWDCLIKTDSGYISGSKLNQTETPDIKHE